MRILLAMLMLAFSRTRPTSAHTRVAEPPVDDYRGSIPRTVVRRTTRARKWLSVALRGLSRALHRDPRNVRARRKRGGYLGWHTRAVTAGRTVAETLASI